MGRLSTRERQTERRSGGGLGEQGSGNLHVLYSPTTATEQQLRAAAANGDLRDVEAASSEDGTVSLVQFRKRRCVA